MQYTCRTHTPVAADRPRKVEEIEARAPPWQALGRADRYEWGGPESSEDERVGHRCNSFFFLWRRTAAAGGGGGFPKMDTPRAPSSPLLPHLSTKEELEFQYIPYKGFSTLPRKPPLYASCPRQSATTGRPLPVVFPCWPKNAFDGVTSPIECLTCLVE